MPEWLSAILFFLPAGVANAAPVVANHIPVVKNWRTPLDFGLKWRGKRLLGDNKSWRGVVVGTLVAGLTAVALSPIVKNDEQLWSSFGLGLLMGFGALFGDAVESFFKRQRGVPSGTLWFPFDQIDYIVGGLLFIAPFADLSVATLGLIFITFFGLHLVFAYVGFMLGWKDSPI